MKLKKCFIIISLGICLTPAFSVIFHLNKGTEQISFGVIAVRIAHFEAFIDMYLYIRANILMVRNPVPLNVREGKDNCFFLGDEFVNIYSKSMNFIQSDEDCIKKVAFQIDSIKRYSENLGYSFYTTIAPSKHTVYPDYLPRKPLPPVSKDIDMLKKQGINLIDMKEYMIPLKDSLFLYYKTDSHWNDYGAFLGAKKLLDVIRQDYPLISELNINDYDIEEFIFEGGDLLKMLKKNVPETQIRLIPKVSIPIQEESQRLKSDMWFRYYNPTKKMKVLVIGDSFFHNIANFISSQFGEVYKIHIIDFDFEILDKEKPDIVIFECAERDICNFSLF